MIFNWFLRILKNLGKINLSEKESKIDDSRKMAQKELKDMNSSELKLFLEPKFETEGYDKTILEDMDREGISGKVLITMNETDFTQIIPKANFGVRRFLTMVVKERTKTIESRTTPQQLCQFECIVGLTDKYVKGHCADVNSYARGKTTTPVRNFHLLQCDDEDFDLVDMSAKVVTFASACMNERRNGTIYFGISPSEKDGYKAGEIVGVNYPRDAVQESINAYLTSAFSDIQRNVIASTVRNARFVPVISGDTNADLYVVEVDVLPSSVMMKKETIQTKLEHLPEFNKKNSSEFAQFRFSNEGFPVSMTPDEMANHERDKSRLIQQRKDDENSLNVQPPPDLSKKLRDLLTGGTEKLDPTTVIFLVLGPIDSHMDQEFISKNLSFIKNINPEVIFDFDPTGSCNGIYKFCEEGEVMKVLTAENFEKEGKSLEERNKFLENLEKQKHIPWIFCNGYEALSLEKMTTMDWNHKRRILFLDALKFYMNNNIKDRIIFMICLFSNDFTAVIDACDDVLTQRPTNLLLLSENEAISNFWLDQMFQRQRVDQQFLLESSIKGMPWENINVTINQTLDKNYFQECPIPCSSGHTTVPEKKLKDWCDIDFISALDFKIAKEKTWEIEKDMEEKFYKGGQVNWLNFCFHDQVLKRDIHEEFKKLVIEALQGKDKDEGGKITTVVVLHQPGAGGTTSSKHVLWDLRKDYRCCVVNTITDETADQLDEIRCFGDKSPKPLLILLDNEEEEDYYRLKEKLEEKGRQQSRLNKEFFKVYCTIIICLRQASLPVQRRGIGITLPQKLSSVEQDWFDKKFKILETRFQRNNDNNDPKFLISFNIYKENFNEAFVLNVVKKFSDDVKITPEINILKILSFLNTYDLSCKPVTLSCIDKVLNIQSMFWRNTWSQGFTVLSNFSLNIKQTGRPKNSLSVNRSIAHVILKMFLDKTGQKESDIMLELINSGVCVQWNYESKELLKSLVNIMIKREFYAPDKISQFSQFINYLSENEGVQIAVDLMKKLFHKTQNPFIAQQISRMYSIKLKGWEQAEHYAKIGTDLQPNNSYFWDTYGQIFKNQLSEKLELANSNKQTKALNGTDVHQLIELAQKAMDCFKEAQYCSKQESGKRNFAGYFNELKAIEKLLNALKLHPELAKNDNLHRFLVDELYQPKDIDKNDTRFLKLLEKIAMDTIKSIDEEFHLIVKRAGYPIERKDYEETLLDLKMNLDEYFGTSMENIPQYLDENGACVYRLRRARKLGAISLKRLLGMKQDGKLNELKQIYDLLIENVSLRENSDDLRLILDTVTVCLLGNVSIPQLRYEDILKWCQRLYSLRSSITTHSLKDAYFYYVLYNFPTKNRSDFNICKPDDFKHIMSSMVERCEQNKDRVLFYLGNGSPLCDIVHFPSVTIEQVIHSLRQFQPSEFRSMLRLHTGTLLQEGKNIKYKFNTKEKLQFELTISTFQPVSKEKMWQKKVNFYICFTFSGPKAFGITSHEFFQGDKINNTQTDSKTHFPRSENHDSTPFPYQNLSCQPRHLAQNQPQHPNNSYQNRLPSASNVNQTPKYLTQQSEYPRYPIQTPHPSQYSLPPHRNFQNPYPVSLQPQYFCQQNQFEPTLSSLQYPYQPQPNTQQNQFDSQRPPTQYFHK